MQLSEFAAQHEEDLWRFVEGTHRKRFRELLANPKRRDEIIDSLNHFKHLDFRYATDVAGSDPGRVLAWLRERGAPRECYAISTGTDLGDFRFDRKHLEGWDDLGVRFPLQKALKLVFYSDVGSLFSCVPGKLGFITGGIQDHWVFHRPD